MDSDIYCGLAVLFQKENQVRAKTSRCHELQQVKLENDPKF